MKKITKMMNNSSLLTLNDASVFLGVSRNFILDKVKRGILKQYPNQGDKFQGFDKRTRFFYKKPDLSRVKKSFAKALTIRHSVREVKDTRDKVMRDKLLELEERLYVYRKFILDLSRQVTRARRESIWFFGTLAFLEGVRLALYFLG